MTPLPPDADARRAAIQQRAEKATKGPWSIAPCSDTDERRDIVADYTEVEGGAVAHWIAELDAQIDLDSDVESQLEELEANAEFIAHVRDDIPYLLDLMARLLAEQTRLQERASTLEDAAFHFQTCRTCKKDGEDNCESGRVFAAFLCGEPLPAPPVRPSGRSDTKEP